MSSVYDNDGNIIGEEYDNEEQTDASQYWASYTQQYRNTLKQELQKLYELRNQIDERINYITKRLSFGRRRSRTRRSFGFSKKNIKSSIRKKKKRNE
jgi:hypothetical protein